mgnify:CR=1 FL=1
MKKIFIFIFLITSTFINAQKEAAIWYFGEKAGLDFNSGSPVVLSNGELTTNEGCASIADSNGNLLFYTDGSTIWNRNHIPMPNGTGLYGHFSSTQSAIIVPSLSNPNNHFVFTVDEAGAGNGFNYSVVDMTLNGGLGNVTSKNIRLYNRVTEKITAVQHANGTDIWVIAHRYNSNEFLAYLVTAAGVSATPIVSAIGVPHEGLSDGTGARGYMKASPNGAFLAITTDSKEVEILQFNTTNGSVSNPLNISNSFNLTPFLGTDFPYGVEFSTDNTKVYFSILEFKYPYTFETAIYQFDVSNYNLGAVEATKTKIAPTTSGEYGSLQLAIDGKIYVAKVGGSFLSVINNPNGAGTTCDFQPNAISVVPGTSMSGLPPFITSYFVVSFNASNFCLGDATEFSVNVSEPITSISWDFGDGGTSTLETPSNVYANTGVYTVSVTVNTASETKTETKEITIFDKPVANTSSSIEVCNHTANYEVDLTAKDAEILATQSPSSFKVTYHSTFAEAQNGTNELPNRYTNSNAIETLYARVSNVNNRRCYAITNFDLIVKKAPALETVADWIECDTDTDGLFQFDFTSKNVEVLNGQDASVFSVSYFRNNSDALSDSNPIIGNYQNTNPAETIYFRLYNTSYPECFELGNFEIEVINGVSATSPTAFEICDSDNDGFSEFDLSTKDSEILGVQSPANFTVTYYLTQQDAVASINALDKTDYTNTSAFAQTLYARVSNNNNSLCYETTTLDVKVYKTPILNEVLDWHVCDTDNDGIFSFNLNQKNSEIIGSQFATEFGVRYFENEVDAMSGTNAIFGNWNNVTKQQQVFYRLENKLNSNCYLTDSFSVKVHNSPSANTSTPLVACDVNKTGAYTFDLSVKDIEVLGIQSPSEYVISYFSNETNAIANQNELNKTAHTNQQATETIYARIANVNFESCYAITNFELILNSLPLIELEYTYVICPDSPDLVIDGGDFETWEWTNDENVVLSTTQEIEITTLGMYSLKVTATTNGVTCSNSQDFSVVSSGAPETLSIDTSGFSDQIELIIMH